jgi:enolase
MTEYKLINPHIEGEFAKKLYSAESSLDAANEAWSDLSSHFTNCVPRFGFTLECLKTNKFINFEVREKINTEGEVSYTVSESSKKVTSVQRKKFESKLKEFKAQLKKSEKKSQKGGDWLLEDEEMVDLYLLTDHFVTPLFTHYWYYPMFYDVTEYLFVPTWVPTVTPYTWIVY